MRTAPTSQVRIGTAAAGLRSKHYRPLSFHPVPFFRLTTGALSEADIQELAPRFPAWLYLCCDKGPDSGAPDGGFPSIVKVHEGGKHVHVPINHTDLDLALTRRLLKARTTLLPVPSSGPIFISCRSNARAGAVALLYHAHDEKTKAASPTASSSSSPSLDPEDVLKWGKKQGLSFFSIAALVDWVVASLYFILKGPEERPRPLFRQLFEPESSTYTYLLADPESEWSRREGGREGGIDGGDEGPVNIFFLCITHEEKKVEGWRGGRRG